MLRYIKRILLFLLLALNVITLFSLLVTFVPNYISLLSIFKKIGLSVIFACTILLVVAFVCVKLLKKDSVILTRKEYNILIGSSVATFCVFGAAFQISSELAGWNREVIYMANFFSRISHFSHSLQPILWNGFFHKNNTRDFSNKYVVMETEI